MTFPDLAQHLPEAFLCLAREVPWLQFVHQVLQHVRGVARKLANQFELPEELGPDRPDMARDHGAQCLLLLRPIDRPLEALDQALQLGVEEDQGDYLPEKPLRPVRTVAVDAKQFVHAVLRPQVLVADDGHDVIVTAHNKNGVDPQTCQVSAHNQCK